MFLYISDENASYEEVADFFEKIVFSFNEDNRYLVEEFNNKGILPNVSHFIEMGGGLNELIYALKKMPEETFRKLRREINLWLVGSARDSILCKLSVIKDNFKKLSSSQKDQLRQILDPFISCSEDSLCQNAYEYFDDCIEIEKLNDEQKMRIWNLCPPLNRLVYGIC